MAFELIDSVLGGYNATVLAYGMTSSGKTHTMLGPELEGELAGIIPRAFAQVMSGAQNEPHRNFMVQCSFLEIYNEQLRDLLLPSHPKLDIHESSDRGVFVKGCSKRIVRSVQEMMRLVRTGLGSRVTAETMMNSESSRSHAIFTVFVESMERGEGSRGVRSAKLHLVDLAGSERLSKTQASGLRLVEGTKINLSLGALGNVINALLDSKAKHVPYRDSKLTRLLTDSLGGNSRTLVLSTLSTAAAHFEETVCTLRFSARAQMITNAPVINEDFKDTLLRQYQEEIRRLRRELRERKGDNEELMGEVLRLEENILKPGEKIAGTISKEEYLSMKERAETQRRERLLLEEEKKAKEEQLLFMESNYHSLEEEVGEMRMLLKELRQKYKAAAQEVLELENEHYEEKEELLDAVRGLTREVQVYQSVISKLVTPEQMGEIMALAEGGRRDNRAGTKVESRKRLLREESDLLFNNTTASGFKIRSYHSNAKPPHKVFSRQSRTNK